MSKREFVQLAKEYTGQWVAGWYCSEKLDGQRAMWDGGCSIGKTVSEVSWANRDKDSREHKCTGLWSRLGKVIHAPTWWTDGLPRGMVLDMELWMGRGRFQELRSQVGSFAGDWRGVRGYVLDCPSWNSWMQMGEWKGKWLDPSMALGEWAGMGVFEDAVAYLAGRRGEHWETLPQTRLPVDGFAEEVDARLGEVCSLGGEGLVLRNGSSGWVPRRTDSVLKVKKLQDMEGTVVGFTWGRETDKGSRLLGRMGALILDVNGIRLELSGFTDSEREVVGGTDHLERQGLDARTGELKHFRMGQRVTFVYRELSVDGVPKEARYLRLA